MADPQGLKAVNTSATGTVVTGSFYLKAYHCISGGTAGDVVLRDGGASGTIRLQFSIGTGTQPTVLLLPDAGILFETSIHVTLPASANITSFYGV